MDILEQLLSNELLNEDTRNSLKQAFSDLETQIVETQTQRLEVEIRAQLTEQFITERDMLIEAIDSKLGSVLEAELNELKQSISEFRDLEVEYGEKLVESKRELAEQLDKDLAALVHIVESFLDERIASEMNELKTDLTEARKLNFGRKIVEAFRDEFLSLENPANEMAAAVTEATQKLEQTQAAVSQLEASNRKLVESNQQMARDLKLGKLLNNLTGSKRDVMESLLKDVSVEKLDEKYQAYLPRLVEQVATTVETTTIISESQDAATVSDLVVKTGDLNNLTEGEQTRKTGVLTEAEVYEIRRLGGISNI